MADSPDGLKRQRGRRGLDILDHLQKSKTANVLITEMDFPEIREVDSKLIELARKLDAKIVTNDVNLNKVARSAAWPSSTSTRWQRASGRSSCPANP